MEPHSQQNSLADMGRTLGWKVGGVTAFLYIVGYLLLLFTDPLLRLSATSLAPLILFIGVLVGVLPAMLIGMLTGWCIGTLMEHRGARLTRPSAFLIGLLACIGLALPINVVFWPEAFWSSPAQMGVAWGYLFVLGIPSLIYILVGSSMSVWLYARQQRQATKKRRAG